ncbi:hypothetical protein SLEP1_g27591 [Rubroshorea leprosula]|nr:hypothetical protein SLEP1_g27591 [Rubroshorea leprosula]
MTPFALTYGHEAVLPMELTARSLRVMIQHNLQSGEYDEAMMLELKDLEDSRLTALDRLQAQKLKIAKSYNKRVKGKNLAVGDLVWKAILPLGKKDHRFGKWSLNWEGPFRIRSVERGLGGKRNGVPGSCLSQILHVAFEVWSLEPERPAIPLLDHGGTVPKMEEQYRRSWRKLPAPKKINIERREQFQACPTHTQTAQSMFFSFQTAFSRFQQ